MTDAARLIGYVNVQYNRLGQEREFTEQWDYEKLMAALHAQLGEPEIDTSRPKVRRGRKIGRSTKRSSSNRMPRQSAHGFLRVYVK
ncbi:MAG TPA: hypothetical protein VMF61_00760, partial [Candidatus Acidoferrales bacterium]|nr:hypothetical protein [Candidatus Acidoferrales bacterium]